MTEGTKPEPKLRAEPQPNGALVVRAGTDAEVRAALMLGLTHTQETAFKVSENPNGTLSAIPRAENEVAAAVLSGLPYSLPGRLRPGKNK